MISNNKPLMTITAVLLAAMFVISVSDARADVIFVSGNISGVWSADSVIVTDSVRVPPGETLTIEPGVTILFTSYYKFEVLDAAVLHAVGTENDSISFLPFTQGDRSLGIDFINASGQSIMEYCYISDALSSGVHLNNSDITVRNCLIEESEAPSGVEGGGAIEILNGSDALIENNTLRNNTAISHGGAIFISSSSPVIRGNTIIENSASLGNASGGGIHVENNSGARILNNIISENTATALGSFSVRHGRGGGIFISGGSGIVISGNVISDNFVNWEPQTTADGGGLYIINSDPYLANNLIVDNEAESNNGGAIYLYNSDLVMINNTVANNVTGDLGGAIYAEFSNPAIVNSILYFNQDSAGTEIYEENSNFTVSYSDIEGSWPGEGNLDIDPLFRDMFGGDYHLQALMCGDPDDSPLIDAGSPDYFDDILDCNRGLGTELSDLGAYGGQGVPTGVEDEQGRVIPNDFTLFQNYPNPFNASTTISYQLPQASLVTLEVYDMLGRKVETLVNNRPDAAGEHQVTWDASGNSSGMYFYRLEIDGFSITEKMLLLK